MKSRRPRLEPLEGRQLLSGFGPSYDAHPMPYSGGGGPPAVFLAVERPLDPPAWPRPESQEGGFGLAYLPVSPGGDFVAGRMVISVPNLDVRFGETSVLVSPNPRSSLLIASGYQERSGDMGVAIGFDSSGLNPRVVPPPLALEQSPVVAAAATLGPAPVAAVGDEAAPHAGADTEAAAAGPFLPRGVVIAGALGNALKAGAMIVAAPGPAVSLAAFLPSFAFPHEMAGRDPALTPAPGAGAAAEGEEAPASRGAGLLAGFSPFEPGALEKAFDRFLRRLDDREASPPRTGETSDPIPGVLVAVAASLAVAEVARRRVRRAWDERSNAWEGDEDSSHPGLPGLPVRWDSEEA
jgi:hypothetical protein